MQALLGGFVLVAVNAKLVEIDFKKSTMSLKKVSKKIYRVRVFLRASPSPPCVRLQKLVFEAQNALYENLILKSKEQEQN